MAFHSKVGGNQITNGAAEQAAMLQVKKILA
jgi:hypothetical protein